MRRTVLTLAVCGMIVGIGLFARVTQSGAQVSRTGPRVATATMTPESGRRYIEYSMFGQFDTTGSALSGATINDIQTVRSGGGYALGVKTNGTVFGWKSTSYMGMPPGPLNVPSDLTAPGANIIDVLPMMTAAYALHSDRTVTAWGCSPGEPMCDIPSGLSGVASFVGSDEDLSGAVASIAAGAIKTDGSLVLWGVNPPVPDASDLANVKDALLFTNPSTAGLTVVHTDGTVATNSTLYRTCNEGSYQTCPLQTVGGLTGIRSVVRGGDYHTQVFIKSDGSLWCLCNGAVHVYADPGFGVVDRMSMYTSMGNTSFVGMRADGSVFVTNGAGTMAYLTVPLSLDCSFNGAEQIGAIGGAVFAITRNDLSCPTATITATDAPTNTLTRTRTYTPSYTRSVRSPTVVASATTGRLEPTSTPTATVGRVLPSSTATKTLAAKPTKTATRTATKTATRTPTKSSAKPTKTPTKKK